MFNIRNHYEGHKNDPSMMNYLPLLSEKVPFLFKINYYHSTIHILQGNCLILIFYENQLSYCNEK